jgi:SpoIID/LytB domain protein
MNKTIKAPEIQVGILSVAQISFTLNGIFEDEGRTLSMTGKWIAHCSGEKLYLHDDKQNLEFNGVLFLKPKNPKNSSFVLQSVMIGVDFHWQRNEDQIFYGNLKIITEDKKVTAINILSVEDYLISVISSEMKATASKEFLKAHAVISRSWLLAQLDRKRSTGKETGKYAANTSTEDEIVRWYDREDHRNFDVCADDHCQRYQGITRASTPAVEQVIDETFGEVLTYDGAICDTRYYKCCGGVTELFENVWEPVNHPYLQKVTDTSVVFEEHDLNLSNDMEANRWIKANPDAFCNTNDKDVLSQVLNDYDQETNDFFRWKLTYRQSELSELLKIRTGIDFGTVTDLIPLERGVSGRIIRLRIEGTKRTMVIGKELEIRKALSRTHLYSSCFFAEKNYDEAEISFVIYGAGWGHGVGLCQIGAAVMGSRGYSYNEILMHYFRGAVLEKRY